MNHTVFRHMLQTTMQFLHALNRGQQISLAILVLTLMLTGLATRQVTQQYSSHAHFSSHIADIQSAIELALANNNAAKEGSLAALERMQLANDTVILRLSELQTGNLRKSLPAAPNKLQGDIVIFERIWKPVSDAMATLVQARRRLRTFAGQEKHLLQLFDDITDSINLSALSVSRLPDSGIHTYNITRQLAALQHIKSLALKATEGTLGYDSINRGLQSFKTDYSNTIDKLVEGTQANGGSRIADAVVRRQLVNTRAQLANVIDNLAGLIDTHASLQDLSAAHTVIANNATALQEAAASLRLKVLKVGELYIFNGWVIAVLASIDVTALFAFLLSARQPLAIATTLTKRDKPATLRETTSSNPSSLHQLALDIEPLTRGKLYTQAHEYPGGEQRIAYLVNQATQHIRTIIEQTLNISEPLAAALDTSVSTLSGMLSDIGLAEKSLSTQIQAAARKPVIKASHNHISITPIDSTEKAARFSTFTPDWEHISTTLRQQKKTAAALNDAVLDHCKQAKLVNRSLSRLKLKPGNSATTQIQHF